LVPTVIAVQSTKIDQIILRFGTLRLGARELFQTDFAFNHGHLGGSVNELVRVSHLLPPPLAFTALSSFYKNLSLNLDFPL
jgi:hypothetical protein